MSVVVVHLCWERVPEEVVPRLTAVLRPGTWAGDGCVTRRLRCEDHAVFGTEVWADERAAGRGLAALTARLVTAGLPIPESTRERVPGDGWTAD